MPPSPTSFAAFHGAQGRRVTVRLKRDGNEVTGRLIVWNDGTFAHDAPDAPGLAVFSVNGVRFRYDAVAAWFEVDD